MFLVNSRLSLVSAAFQRFGGKLLHVKGPPFSRSYGGILPSSLSIIISIALVFSTYHLRRFRVRATINLARRFSWQHRIIHFALRLGISSQACVTRICLRNALRPYPGTTIARVGLPSCVTPLLNYYEHGVSGSINLTKARSTSRP